MHLFRENVHNQHLIALELHFMPPNKGMKNNYTSKILLALTKLKLC